MKKADLTVNYIRAIDRARFLLSAVETDLEVLGSEFSPHLHEINRQLDELSRQVHKQALDNQGSNNGHPHKDPAPIPVESQPAENGGQPPAETLPDPAQ